MCFTYNKKHCGYIKWFITEMPVQKQKSVEQINRICHVWSPYTFIKIYFCTSSRRNTKVVSKRWKVNRSTVLPKRLAVILPAAILVVLKYQVLLEQFGSFAATPVCAEILISTASNLLLLLMGHRYFIGSKQWNLHFVMWVVKENDSPLTFVSIKTTPCPLSYFSSLQLFSLSNMAYWAEEIKNDNTTVFNF